MTRPTDIGDVNTAIIKHAHLEITSADLANVVNAYVAARLAEEGERIAQAIEALRERAVETAGCEPNYHDPDGRVVAFVDDWLEEAARIARVKEVKNE